MKLRLSILAATAAVPLLAAVPAAAQMDSREGIALQNQILELRRDLDALRRGGVSAAPVPTTRGSTALPGDLAQQLLARVGELEEEVRRLRGQLDIAQNDNRRLTEDVEKLRGDMDFRLQQLEGGGRGAAPRPPRGPAAAEAPAPTPPHPPSNSSARPPERALSEGQAALSRGDYAAAEAAAREVIAGRAGPRTQDANLLLGEALLGKRDYQNAALAFDEAYRRNRQSSRAPEALLGLSNSFLGFGARREACDTLAQLTSEFTRLPPRTAQRVADARRRGRCG
jgi:TolA-binding protein